jgi:microcystin-dependent protein
LSEAFIGEIRLFGFNFNPKSWALCNGQLLAIQQNAALFSILGTTYGGNGTTTFALPNLQSRVPLHFGNQPSSGNYSLGQVGGEESHPLALNEMPAHTHFLNASSDAADSDNPAGNILAQSQNFSLHATTQSGVTGMAPTSIVDLSGNQPHTNLQPYLVVNFCICLFGIFPSRN